METIRQIKTPDQTFFYTLDYVVTVPITITGITGDSNKEIKAGTVLGRISASGKYNVYDNGASDGRETAVGILLYDIVISENENEEAVMVVRGNVIKEKLTGYDANAKIDLSAKEVIIESGKTLVMI